MAVRRRRGGTEIWDCPHSCGGKPAPALCHSRPQPPHTNTHIHTHGDTHLLATLEHLVRTSSGRYVATCEPLTLAFFSRYTSSHAYDKNKNNRFSIYLAIQINVRRDSPFSVSSRGVGGWVECVHNGGGVCPGIPWEISSWLNAHRTSYDTVRMRHRSIWHPPILHLIYSLYHPLRCCFTHQ